MDKAPESADNVSVNSSNTTSKRPSPEKVTLARQIQERMATIEKRDWELWMLSLTMVAILAIGYFFLVFPSVFLGSETIYIEAKLSSPLVLGQLALIMLFLVYMANKHIELRKMRSQSIVETLNFQLSHAQLMLDPLTQAFNRTALEEVLGKEIKRVLRKQTTLVFLYTDVDNLKEVNTQFGHLSGDLVLSEVGATLKSCVRGSDYVIRMGGDEFMVVLVDTSVAGAEVVKARINDRAKSWNENSPLPGYTLGMSIGIQEFDGSRSLDEVLSQADSKMFSEKRKRVLARKQS